VWTTIERLYPHPPHQRFHMPAADLAPLGSQQASQHSRAGEGKLQVHRQQALALQFLVRWLAGAADGIREARENVFCKAQPNRPFRCQAFLPSRLSRRACGLLGANHSLNFDQRRRPETA
jgi:hypothetical protein